MTEEVPVAGRTAIVTGVGPGIGRATALALAAEGSNVVLAARSADVLDGDGLRHTLAASAQRRGITFDDALAELEREVPLGRMPTSEDIADAIVFLASDRARSITGQTLDVNGGRWFS